MSWLSNLFGRKPVERVPTEKPRAAWLAADQNRFGIPVLDLCSITGKLISTSRSEEEAALAVSWDRKLVVDLALDFTCSKTLACDLWYATEPDLPAGWLYTPPAMEPKWAIAYRDSAIYMIRSWTGQVAAVGRARRDGAHLVVDRIELAENTALEVFGDAIETFDWLVRAHALRQLVPLPVCDEGARMLEDVPLSVFSIFGNVAAYAALGWAPPAATRPLRSCSDLATAMRCDQQERMSQLIGSDSINARCPVGGFTPLHVAAIQRNAKLASLLLARGADPNLLADRESSALITAVVHGAPIELLDLLMSHGAAASTPNVDGFGLIHALAETDGANYLAWALARGVDLEARTKHGLTALHIAAALGHVATMRALLAAGADRTARDLEGKTPRDTAVAEKQRKSVKTLDSHR